MDIKKVNPSQILPPGDYFHLGLHLGRIITDCGGGGTQPHGQMTHDNNDTRVSKEETCNKEVVLRETADETEDQPKDVCPCESQLANFSFSHRRRK